MSGTAEIILPGSVPASEITKLLSGEFGVTGGPAVEGTLRFHDTFDWRLFRAGWTLEEQSSGRKRTVRCRDWRNGELVTVSIRARLKRLDDLDGTACQHDLHRISGIRALMTRAELPVRVSDLNLLNEDRKTVVRCRVEQFEPARGQSARAPEPFTAVRLHALRGYETECDRAAARVAGTAGSGQQDGALLRKVMAAQGEVPGAYAAKPLVTLPPSASARDWLCALCEQLLGVMVSNEFGIVQDIDTEFLHDFRIAVRRTRSALGQIRNVFQGATIDRFKDEFAWLGQISGPVRDLDVFLLQFDELRAAVPPELRGALGDFQNYLREHHASERRRLLRHLRSARYRRLVTDWRAFLAAPPAQSLGPAAAEAVVPVAAGQTWRILRRVRKRGRRIDDHSPPEALHELRKSCKELRYMLEFFAPLQAPEAAEHLIKRLKRLQGNLGDFQDASVQIAALHRVAAEMKASESLLAIGALIQRASDRSALARSDFHRRFRRFDTRSTVRLFEGLFAPARASLPR